MQASPARNAHTTALPRRRHCAAGEIIEWAGYAVATWSLPGLAFALFTLCNLGPRGWQHHQWYRQHFKSYPPQRRAVIPWVW
jgi:hypothetical protein